MFIVLFLLVTMTSSCILSEEANLDVLIVSNFLAGRIEKNERGVYPDQTTLQEKILGPDATKYLKLYDIDMTLSQEQGADGGLVMIKTTVFGTPEDFDGTAILENEKKLLKFILIGAYLAKLKEMANKKIKQISLTLSPSTKALSTPECLVREKNGLYTFRTEYETCESRKAMEFLTIFTLADFHACIKNYVAAKNAKKA